MVWCFFPDKPPAEVKAKGATGTKNQLFLDKQNNPYGFAVGLKDVACKEPGCCCIATLGAPCGCTACWARKAVLEKYAGGVDNYTCLQNYIPKCCCITTTDMCKGSMLGLCLEGCCCPMFSLSIARIHLMDMKQVQPDPCDWQIIACSNCLQCIACILDIIAIFVEEAREVAEIINCIADLFTMSVGGCMGAQVHHEIKGDANGTVNHPVVQGVVVGGAPMQEVMER